MAARTARERDRRHRLDRQDLDQGPPARDPAPHRRTVASRANFNTEIGLPLEILDAPPGPRCWCSRWGCAAPGQIAELGAIAEPDVAVIVSIGPVHLELLGTIEAIAAAKAELIAALPPGGTAVVPADERPARRPTSARTCRHRHVRRRR